MLKRKIFLDKKIIRYKIWEKGKLSSIIKKSFLRNYAVDPIRRFSLIIQSNYSNNDFQFYKSQNKLQCYMSYSFKVPTKRLNLSRFYLTRSVNKLYLGGYQK